jgi:Putative zinc-finger
MSCPDLLALSQLADGELAEAEAASLGAHTAACTSCRQRLERLGHALTAVSVAAHQRSASAGELSTSADDPMPSADCLTPTQIAAWLDAPVGDADQGRRSLHLESCSRCLGQAITAARIMRRLSAAPAVAVPDALKARVASRWPVAQPEATLTALVIRVTRAGVRFLERTLVAPMIDIVDLAASPAPALRAGGSAPGLRFQLQAAEARISATVEPVGDAVSLTLVVEDGGSEALPDQRVFLRRHGRSIYSARTDESGAVRMPDLERGVYEVSFPALATAFRIDLRA